MIRSSEEDCYRTVALGERRPTKNAYLPDTQLTAGDTHSTASLA